MNSDMSIKLELKNGESIGCPIMFPSLRGPLSPSATTTTTIATTIITIQLLKAKMLTI
jgi:hypothetical protein